MTHTDPRIPTADACVFRNLLDRHAAAQPDKVFASFAMDEPDWSYADLRRKVLSTANALRKLGVRQGDHVVCWLENGPLTIRVWLAVNYMAEKIEATIIGPKMFARRPVPYTSPCPALRRAVGNSSGL